MMQTIKNYVDLTRIQFFFVWPLLFLSGLFLSFSTYGGFDWMLIAKSAVIALLGFEAGLVLNDYVDRDFDRRDVESDKLTKYWRLFGMRPLASGKVSPNTALILFLILASATTALILTLPSPNSYWVLGIMLYSYFAEVFYQIQKRRQSVPIAQLIGRTDFSLFPIAGYLTNGRPDLIPVLYFLFFYPYAQAHLGMNDLVDVVNDEARGMKTIPILYGLKKTGNWVHLFTALHILGALLFATVLGTVARTGLFIGICILVLANLSLGKSVTAENALKILPMFHVAMIVYTASIILGYFFAI
jgi:4-hydroxybenzoate polyprenyltransferase